MCGSRALPPGPAAATATRSAAVGSNNYFATGMVNSAPLAMLSGQRCITLL
ncbi:hypothetical protein BOSP111201_17530 [Bordetella sputigena]